MSELLQGLLLASIAPTIAIFGIFIKHWLDKNNKKAEERAEKAARKRESDQLRAERISKADRELEIAKFDIDDAHRALNWQHARCTYSGNDKKLLKGLIDKLETAEKHWEKAKQSHAEAMEEIAKGEDS